MNKEYPTSPVLTTVPSGVARRQDEADDQGRGQVGRGRRRLRRRLHAIEAGKKTFTGELKFAVCSATTCDPKKSNVSFEIDVK